MFKTFELVYYSIYNLHALSFRWRESFNGLWIGFYTHVSLRIEFGGYRLHGKTFQ